MHIPNPNFKPKAREKSIEPSLKAAVEKAGGWCLKLPALYISGLPDRLCLLPLGRAVFVETKSQGKKPSKLQAAIHNQIRKLGFKVYVVSNREELKEFRELELKQC